MRLSRFDGNNQIFSTVSEVGAEVLGWLIWRPPNPQGLGNVREAIPGDGVPGNVPESL